MIYLVTFLGTFAAIVMPVHFYWKRYQLKHGNQSAIDMGDRSYHYLAYFLIAALVFGVAMVVHYVLSMPEIDDTGVNSSTASGNDNVLIASGAMLTVITIVAGFITELLYQFVKTKGFKASTERLSEDDRRRVGIIALALISVLFFLENKTEESMVCLVLISGYFTWIINPKFKNIKESLLKLFKMDLELATTTIILGVITIGVLIIENKVEDAFKGKAGLSLAGGISVAIVILLACNIRQNKKINDDVRKKREQKIIMRIGKELAKYRSKNHISQEELADELNLSITCLDELEKGKRSPDIDLLLRITSRIKMPLNDVLKNIEEVYAEDCNNVSAQKCFEIISNMTDEKQKLMLEIVELFSKSDILKNANKIEYKTQ